MLKSVVNPQNYVRFRMSVSVPPVSQQEVGFIYNVFKHKTQLLGDIEDQSELLRPYNAKPIEQIFYRHSKGRNRLTKFDRFIDVIYDLGGIEGKVDDAIARQVYDYKLENLITMITKLKGILRLSQYEQTFLNEKTRSRHLRPFYKMPRDIKNPSMFMRRQTESLTRARHEKPYYDIKTNDSEIDYTERSIRHLDFDRVFQVHTIKYFIGNDAISYREDLVDDSVRDRLLFGFDGFVKKR